MTLRELLHALWCPLHAQTSDLGSDVGRCDASCVFKASLAMRMPECVPVGLDTFRGGWRIYGEGEDDECCITDEQATLMFVGKALIDHPGLLYRIIDQTGRTDKFPKHIVAAIHKLADERADVSTVRR